MTDGDQVPSYIVTGANSGIGKATALGLAQKGLRVVMVCRDEGRGHLARAEIIARNGGSNVELVIGDLSSCAGVRAAGEKILDICPRIGALINNAGIWMMERTLNADGIEMTFFVNHLAPFLLTQLLLERLKASAPSRVINVNAGLYIFGRFDPARTPTGKDFSRLRTYPTSKLCGVYFTRELARRLERTGVTVNALHPGVIRTNLAVTHDVKGALLRLFKVFLKSPARGARGPIHLATAPELREVSGLFFNQRRRFPTFPMAKHESLGRQLWDISAALTGLSLKR